MFQRIACGSSPSLIVTRDGRQLSFGNNSVSQLGLGSKAGDDDVLVPTAVQIRKDKPTTALVAGGGGQFSAVLASTVA